MQVTLNERRIHFADGRHKQETEWKGREEEKEGAAKLFSRLLLFAEMIIFEVVTKQVFT